MAPAVLIDNTPDIDMDFSPPIKSSTFARTLLLAPPSVAAHPSALSQVSAAYDRSATDIQMLDRLALGLVALPPATYDLVLLLTDVDQTRTEGSRLVNRDVMSQIALSLKAGGKLQLQNSQSTQLTAAEETEAILAGLVMVDGQVLLKPDSANAPQTVTLKFGKKKANAAAVPANAIEAETTIKRKSEEISGNGSAGIVKVTPAGVGFIDNTAEFGDAYDDEDVDFPSDSELQNAAPIDPSTLLSEADRQKPLDIPEACKPNSKRRRACKDCSCGLAERLAAEDAAKRANADASLAKLSANELTEVDFTVQGKVGSCGNCALGDAFRCDGCPYIGLPAFKPGEEVRLLNNDVQL